MLDEAGDRVDCDRATRTCRERILVIGDSFAEALAVPYQQTVWGRLERTEGRCAFVAAVAGHDPGQYVQTARERLPGGAFDLLIVAFYAGNDFVDDAFDIPEPKEVQRQPLRLLPRGLTLHDLRDWFYPFNSWLESRSHAYVATRHTIRRFRDPGDVGLYGVPRALRPSRLTERYLDETRRAIAEIARIAEHHGTRTLVSVLPTRSQVLDPTAERLLRALPRLKGDVDMDLVSERFVPRLRSAPEVDAVVDLLPVFRGRSDPSLWGSRDVHLSPEGHAAWMEGIRVPLERLLTESRPTPRFGFAASGT